MLKTDFFFSFLYSFFLLFLPQSIRTNTVNMVSSSPSLQSFVSLFFSSLSLLFSSPFSSLYCSLSFKLPLSLPLSFPVPLPPSTPALQSTCMSGSHRKDNQPLQYAAAQTGTSAACKWSSLPEKSGKNKASLSPSGRGVKAEAPLFGRVSAGRSGLIRQAEQRRAGGVCLAGLKVNKR